MKGKRFSRRAVLLTIASLCLCAFALVGSTGSNAAPRTDASFRLADGSAACAALRSGAVVCRSTAAPKAMVLTADGTSRAAEVAVKWDESTPVLLASESFWIGRISCRALATAIQCTTHGSTISVGKRRVGAAL